MMVIPRLIIASLISWIWTYTQLCKEMKINTLDKEYFT